MIRAAWTIATFTAATLPAGAWAQERAWDAPWELHPLWWPFVALAAALVLLILLGWALLNLAPVVLGIIGAVLGIRWLIGATGARRSDPAAAIVRERYARGEINKDEFEAKMRDLGGRP